jgi:hypothetical protein
MDAWVHPAQQQRVQYSLQASVLDEEAGQLLGLFF